MKTADTFSSEWYAVKTAETELVVSHYYLRKRDDFLGQMLLALNSLQVDEAVTALKFMKYADCSDSELAELSLSVIDIAVDGKYNELLLARDVLSKYRNRKIVRDIFDSVVDKYLSTPDDYIYLRLAEVLVELCYDDHFKRLMLLCKNSDNPDIAEICDFFPSFYDPT